MDNFTHSLTGWALGQTGLKRKTRKGLAALILGANMPDIDVFFSWVPWEPMSTHRGFSHSFTGGLWIMPPILALLLWSLDRWQVKRGAAFKSGLAMHFGWLVALCYLGAVTNPLLDWQNSYSVQFLSPFSNLWFHNDALFIIDVWVWSGLAFAIWLSRRKEKRGIANWGRPASIALAVFVAYIGANSLLTDHAKSVVARVEGGEPEISVASPEPAFFYRRSLVWRTDEGIRYGSYDPFLDWSGLQEAGAPIADNMNDPLARRAMRATPEIISHLNWSILPMAQIERRGCEANVVFSDARFARQSRPDWMQSEDEAGGDGEFRHGVVIPLEGPNCP